MAWRLLVWLPDEVHGDFVDISLLVISVLLLVILVAACLLPVYADSADDRGDGRTKVIIPRYTRTPVYRPRTWAFLVIAAVLGLLFLGLHRPSLPALYADAVSRVAAGITHDPARVNGYVMRLRPALAFFAVGYFVAIALVIRAELARRLAVLAHVALYLAMTVLSQALMIVAGIASGWLVAPFGIEATLANLLIGGLVVMRLTFTTFALPRATTVAKVRCPRLWDNILAWCSLLSVITLLVAAYAFISQQANLNSAWQVFLPLYAVTLLFTLMYAPLWLIWWLNRSLPQPGSFRSAVDIIIPALQRRGEHRAPAHVDRHRCRTLRRAGPRHRLQRRLDRRHGADSGRGDRRPAPRPGPGSQRPEWRPGGRAEPWAGDHRRGDRRPRRRRLRPGT
jgi:hypothetical protein